MHRFTGHDARRLTSTECVGRCRLALAVKRVAQRVNDAPEQALPTGTSTMAPVRLTVSPS